MENWSTHTKYPEASEQKGRFSAVPSVSSTPNFPVSVPGGSDHPWSGVDAGQRCIGESLCEIAEQEACSASDIEDPLRRRFQRQGNLERAQDDLLMHLRPPARVVAARTLVERSDVSIPRHTR